MTLSHLETELKTLIRTFVTAEEPVKAHKLEGTDHAERLHYLIAVGFAKVDDVSDDIAVTTEGRLFAGLKPDGVPDLAVEVAEITGNIDERELAARYMEGKIAAIDVSLAKHEEPQYSRMMTWQECYQHIAIVLRESAYEFRCGLHLPIHQIDGRVIPYNDDRSTGVRHQINLALFFSDVYLRNVKAGWWTDLETGGPKKRNVGELFILMVTELAEAYKAYANQEQDDKLPQYPGLGVEMGDLLIRIADFCGALAAGNIIFPAPGVYNPGDEMFADIVAIAEQYESIRKTPAAVGDTEIADYMPAQDVAAMVDAKLDYNAHRADHKIENRLKDDGKKT